MSPPWNRHLEEGLKYSAHPILHCHYPHKEEDTSTETYYGRGRTQLPWAKRETGKISHGNGDHLSAILYTSDFLQIARGSITTWRHPEHTTIGAHASSHHRFVGIPILTQTPSLYYSPGRCTTVFCLELRNKEAFASARALPIGSLFIRRGSTVDLSSSGGICGPSSCRRFFARQERRGIQVRVPPNLCFFPHGMNRNKP